MNKATRHIARAVELLRVRDTQNKLSFGTVPKIGGKAHRENALKNVVIKILNGSVSDQGKPNFEFFILLNVREYDIDRGLEVDDGQWPSLEIPCRHVLLLCSTLSGDSFVVEMRKDNFRIHKLDEGKYREDDNYGKYIPSHDWNMFVLQVSQRKSFVTNEGVHVTKRFTIEYCEKKIGPPPEANVDPQPESSKTLRDDESKIESKKFPWVLLPPDIQNQILQKVIQDQVPSTVVLRTNKEVRDYFKDVMKLYNAWIRQDAEMNDTKLVLDACNVLPIMFGFASEDIQDNEEVAGKVYESHCGTKAEERENFEGPTPLDEYAYVLESLACICGYGRDGWKTGRVKIPPIMGHKTLEIILARNQRVITFSEKLLEEVLRRRLKAHFMKNRLNNRMQTYVVTYSYTDQGPSILMYNFRQTIGLITVYYKQEEGFFREINSNGKLVNDGHNFGACLRYSFGWATGEIARKLVATCLPEMPFPFLCTVCIDWKEPSASEVLCVFEEIFGIAVRGTCPVVLINSKNETFAKNHDILNIDLNDLLDIRYSVHG